MGVKDGEVVMVEMRHQLFAGSGHGTNWDSRLGRASGLAGTNGEADPVAWTGCSSSFGPHAAGADGARQERVPHAAGARGAGTHGWGSRRAGRRHAVGRG